MKMQELLFNAILKKGLLYESDELNLVLDVPGETRVNGNETITSKDMKVTITGTNIKLKIERD